MNRQLKLILILLSGFIPAISFCQDTTTTTFKISKIFATAAGKIVDTVDRQDLVDSGNIVIHGCPDCRVLGFQMEGKNRGFSGRQIAMDTLATRIPDSDTSRVKAPQFDWVLKSKSDLFTSTMKRYMTNPYYAIVNYVEIFDIKIITPEGQEMKLNKIRLFLK